MFARLILEYHRKRMSELGKELEEAAQDDVWTLSEHRWTHKESRIAFWISNGFRHFRLHEAGPYSDTQLKGAINIHDKHALWACYQKHLRHMELKPAATALNLLRLKRQNPSEK